MTPDERERFKRWCARRLPAYGFGLFFSAFFGLCQALNILDPDNSGDEGWLTTVLLIGVPIAVNMLAVGTYRSGPRVNQALVKARRKSLHRRDTDLRKVYRP